MLWGLPGPTRDQHRLPLALCNVQVILTCDIRMIFTVLTGPFACRQQHSGACAGLFPGVLPLCQRVDNPHRHPGRLRASSCALPPPPPHPRFIAASSHGYTHVILRHTQPFSGRPRFMIGAMATFSIYYSRLGVYQFAPTTQHWFSNRWADCTPCVQ